MSRKLLKNIDTKQKVYGLIPLKTFLLCVLPFSGTLVLLNLLALISETFSILFFTISSILVSINVFLFSEIRFGQSGLRVLLDFIFNSKIEYYEKVDK